MKKQMVIGLMFLCCVNIYTPILGVQKQWTWMYKTFFTPQERIINDTKKEISFTTTDIAQFTQCIFSWNATRPKRGYFSFHAQVRDAKTKKWHVWHKMFDWGSDIQRSHLTTTKTGTSYHYVRLEAPKDVPADGIRIRIESHGDAPLKNIYGLFFSASRLDEFVPENPSQFFNLPSVQIKGIPLFSQKVLDHPRKDGLCSPTSLSMVTSFLAQKKVDPCVFANHVHDTGFDAYGSWSFNTAHAFEHVGGDYCFYVRRLSSFAMLYQSLQKNIPVVVSVRGVLSGAAKAYLQGHLLVAIGWDQKKKSVICHDPAFLKDEDVWVTYPLKDFLQAWERSRRLAYIAEPFFP